jgi:hypothetical protein
MYKVSGIQMPEIPTITTRERATAVTVGLVLAMGLLISALIYCFIQASTALTHIIGDKQTLDSIHQMLFIALFLTPVTVTGGFWLGLWRLSQVTTMRAWLNTMTLGLALFSGTAGAMGIEASLLSANGAPVGPLWWIVALFQFPLLIPLNAALGIVCSGAGFLCALLFANWDAARTAATIDNGKRDFALVGAVASAYARSSSSIWRWSATPHYPAPSPTCNPHLARGPSSSSSPSSASGWRFPRRSSPPPQGIMPFVFSPT